MFPSTVAFEGGVVVITFHISEPRPSCVIYCFLHAPNATVVIVVNLILVISRVSLYYRCIRDEISHYNVGCGHCREFNISNLRGEFILQVYPRLKFRVYNVGFGHCCGGWVYIPGVFAIKISHYNVGFGHCCEFYIIYFTDEFILQLYPRSEFRSMLWALTIVVNLL